MSWLKEHPTLALGVGALAVFLVIRSLAKKNQDQTASGSGAQGDLQGGQVVSAGGYTFVPTGSSDLSSSTTSGDMNPNVSQDLQALTGFLQATQAPMATPATPAGSGAPASDTSGGGTDTSGGNGFDLSGLAGLLGGGLSGPSITGGNTTVKVNVGNKPKTTKHTHGTPNQAPGIPHVAPHPHNPSPMPPTRTAPITHPAQGKNHPIAGPIPQKKKGA